MISPICLENLVQIGMDLGLVMEAAERDAGKERSLVPYQLSEVLGGVKRIMEYCPQKEEDRNDPDDPRRRLEVLIPNLQDLWDAGDHGTAIVGINQLHNFIMEWMNDIAFAGPSRVAVKA
tara:strand:+ start:257 stop:616 length:360 start_codon:yes stop_codon:yes gene_type:complete